MDIIEIFINLFFECLPLTLLIIFVICCLIFVSIQQFRNKIVPNYNNLKATYQIEKVQ